MLTAHQEELGRTVAVKRIRPDKLHETARRGEFATGVIYIEPDRDDFLEQLNVVDEPLATLPESVTKPPKSALDALMANLASVVDAVVRARPTGAKGTYVKSVVLSSTMSPSVRLDVPAALALKPS